MGINFLYPVPSYDSFMNDLLNLDEWEHRMVFGMKYAIGGRLNEWPIKFRKEKLESGKKRLTITCNTLKNPIQQIRECQINMEAEPELVQLVREFRKEYRERDPAEWWGTDRTLRNWYYKSLGKIYEGTSPHFLRHVRATHVRGEWKRLGFKGPVDIIDFKKYFGWRSAVSADRYSHVGLDLI